MRLTSLHFLAFFIIQCNGTGNFKTIIGLYCPNESKWDWHVDIHESLTPSDPLSSRHGHAADNFQYVQMELDSLTTLGNGTKLVYSINQNCTNDGKSFELLFEFSLFPDRVTYGFIAVNLLTRLDTNAYEKLFIQYLKNECPTGDCSSILEQIDCSYHSVSGTIDFCEEGLEKAVSMHSATTTLQVHTDSSSQTTPETSNTSTFVIFGAAVGAVLIMAAFVACFFCERQEKFPDPSMAKSMEESGKSAKTTTTGESQKTEETGTKSH